MASCPICNAPGVSREKSQAFPFCSARCKTLDLGNWLSDAYRVPVEDVGVEDEPAPPPSASHDSN